MGKLYVVGTGSGDYEDLTIKADRILRESHLIFCDEKIYKMLVDHFNKTKLISNSYNETRERCKNAIESAIKDKIISIVGSGDTGVYGISSIILELVEEINPNIEVNVIPGITSAISGASLLGSPLVQDFAIISLSDNIAEKDMMLKRIDSVAKSNFGIVFYSPHNSTYNNLILAKEILLQYRKLDTIVGVVKNIGGENQKVLITDLGNIDLSDIDAYTTIFIGRDNTKISQTKVKKMITPLY